MPAENTPYYGVRCELAYYSLRGELLRVRRHGLTCVLGRKCSTSCSMRTFHVLLTETALGPLEVSCKLV